MALILMRMDLGEKPAGLDDLLETEEHVERDEPSTQQHCFIGPDRDPDRPTRG